MLSCCCIQGRKEARWSTAQWSWLGCWSLMLIMTLARASSRGSAPRPSLARRLHGLVLLLRGERDGCVCKETSRCWGSLHWGLVAAGSQAWLLCLHCSHVGGFLGVSRVTLVPAEGWLHRVPAWSSEGSSAMCPCLAPLPVHLQLDGLEEPLPCCRVWKKHGLFVPEREPSLQEPWPGAELHQHPGAETASA